jgi:hypothetical protein
VASDVSGGLLCTDPVDKGDELDVGCSTLGPPVCLGGAEGASGSGVLAEIPFESRGGGVTALSFGETLLVLDDFAPPCDPTEGAPQRIFHTAEGASVELAPKDDSSMTLIIVIIVVVVVVVVAAGGGFLGYRWYRQRQGPGSA